MDALSHETLTSLNARREAYLTAEDFCASLDAQDASTEGAMAGLVAVFLTLCDSAEVDAVAAFEQVADAIQAGELHLSTSELAAMRPGLT